MFSLALLALAFVASAAPVTRPAAAPRAMFTPPSGWATEWLESYDAYHLRYKALDCRSQHDTTFFDACCHPMLATESLTSRPAQCTPGAAVAVSSGLVASSSATSSAPASATTSSTGAFDDDDDEDLPYCDEIEESSSAVPTSTSAAAPVASVPVETTPAAVAATTTTAPAPAASTPTAAAPSTGGDVKTGGHATYFYQGGNAGACGNVNSDSTPLAAITYKYWGGSAGGGSSMCGKTLDVTRVSTGKTVSVIVADLCPSCTGGDNSLDLSEGAFTQLASKDEGMVDITWTVRD